MTAMYWLAFAFGVLWGLWAGQASQRRSRLGRVFPGTFPPPTLSVQWQLA